MEHVIYFGTRFYSGINRAIQEQVALFQNKLVISEQVVVIHK